jgi:FkbM family methyltransferase
MSIVKKLAYKTIDALTSGSGIERRIGGQSIRFPARWSRYYETDYEPETFRFFREYLKPGDTVLDIGGHIGLFAVVAARLTGRGGKVYSFEPTPFTRGVLQEVVDLNGCGDIVEVRREAVTSTRGEMTFFDTGDEISNANSLVRTGRSKVEMRVPTVSIDEFSAERELKIDCLKIDVEGAELDVLKGAHETFLNDRPVARLGLHPPFIAQNGQTLEEVWRLLSEYKLDVVFDDKTVSREWFCSQTELFDVNLIPA